MSLVPYLDVETAPPKSSEILKRAKERFEHRLGAMAKDLVPNSMRLMAHRPEILEGFNAFARSVLDGGVLEPGLKRLATLKTSLANKCAY
jgi:alkylhydroperoxidase family enzyme